MKKLKEYIESYGKKNLIIRLLSIVITIVLASLILIIFSDTKYYKNDYNIDMTETHGNFSKLVKSKVISIDDIYYPDKSEGKSYTVCITFTAELLKGDNKGERVSVKQYLNDYTSHFYNQVKKGQKVYITEEKTSENDEPTYYFAGDSLSYDHITGIVILASILALSLILVSRTKGVLTIISLALTIVVAILIFLPGILNGKNIYLLTIFLCVYVISVTFVLVAGFNKKCLCAGIGCMSGLLLSGLLAVITLRIINATGHFAQEDVSEVTILFQTMYNVDIVIDLKGLIFASTIIGALGAVMDVSLSLSSALKEVYDNSDDHSFIKTIKSGFVIGKDMIGTMTNTLILAYLASDMAFILYLMIAHSDPFILQSEYIAVAIAQALVGSIAMVLTIPLTSAICALIYNKKRKKEENIEIELKEEIDEKIQID